LAPLVVVAAIWFPGYGQVRGAFDKVFHLF